jgi:hypothetical protein
LETLPNGMRGVLNLSTHALQGKDKIILLIQKPEEKKQY